MKNLSMNAKMSDSFKIRYIIILFACVFLYSCTASNETETKPDITFEVIKARVNANAQKLRSLDADGDISIESPTISSNGSVTVSINKPDSVFIKLEGPFGIDVANLLITRSNFVYYNVMDNRVIKGPSSPKNLGIIMRIKIEFDDIINAFSGKFAIGNDTYDETKITSAGINYLVTLKKKDETLKYWINSEDFYVTRFGSYDNEGNTKIEISYENFYQKDDVYFPKKISITRPKEKQNIWLNYSKEEFNNNRLTFRLKIPKSAKQTNWQ
ncbi:MAG: DUF4292 domain-containing protein [Ignavibacteria bacterium]